jgi:hypothetical protein
VSCIEEALNHLAVKEELQGYTCSKTNAQVGKCEYLEIWITPGLCQPLEQILYESVKKLRHGCVVTDFFNVMP